MNYIILIDRLERIKLLQGDPLVEGFEISVTEPETVYRFLVNFNNNTAQMMLEESYAKVNQ